MTELRKYDVKHTEVINSLKVAYAGQKYIRRIELNMLVLICMYSGIVEEFQKKIEYRMGNPVQYYGVESN